MTAIEEEERARRRQDDKQKKLKEFQKHTQTNANKKLREDIAAKERAEQER